MVRPKGADLAFLGQLADQGRLRPMLGRTFPLERAREAHDESERGHTRGKIVLEVGFLKGSERVSAMLRGLARIGSSWIGLEVLPNSSYRHKSIIGNKLCIWRRSSWEIGRPRSKWVQPGWSGISPRLNRGNKIQE